MAHGAALVRVGQVMAHREVPAEREARPQAFSDTAAREPTMKRVLKALRPVRGPIRFLDLGPGEFSVDTQDQEQPQRATAEENTAATEENKAAEAENNGTSNMEGAISALQRSADEVTTAEKNPMEVETDEERKRRIDKEVDQMFEDLEKEVDEKGDKRERSRSPPPEDDQCVRMLNISHEAARKLDGLAPRPLTAKELDGACRELEGTRDKEVGSDDELLAEEFNEKRFSPEEKKLFDEAKDQTLKVWIKNEAWRAVPMEEADPEETVPARFLQRWKPKPGAPGGKVANARVILQGFKYRDVLTKEIEIESPTLSRMEVVCHRCQVCIHAGRKH